MSTSNDAHVQAQKAYGNPNSRRPHMSAANAASPNTKNNGLAHPDSHAKPPGLRAASASQAPSTSPSIRNGVSTSAATSLPPKASDTARISTEPANRPPQIRI